MGRRKLKPNVFVVCEEQGLVYIHLSGKWGMGEISIVDLHSFNKHNLAAYTWACTKEYYVYAVIEGKTVYLHRLVSGNNTKLHTDHIGGSEGKLTLDNRKENLRICSNQDNQMNGKVRSDNKTGYKNVSKYKDQYRCMIRVDKTKEYYGIYDKPEQAALAYNLVISHYADVYQLNEIPDGSLSQEEIEYVHSVVNKRQDKIKSKYQLYVPESFKYVNKVALGIY